MSECLPDLPRHVRQSPEGFWIGADHQNGPWRTVPAPQSGLPWRTDGPAVQSREPASVAAEARTLSPAAQAVEAAVLRVASVPGLERRRIIAAAALRAVAVQLFPEERPPYDAFLEWSRLHPSDSPPWDVRASKRAELLAIATELEGTNG